ncbi:MAG: glycosyltransferase, partial [Bacteroidetes bacterium]|nr:glycosyltransferase [Bacteroidota bacterium]
MIEFGVFWILIVLSAVYVVFHSFLWRGINRLFHPKFTGSEHWLSVIVAARNEEQNIGALLESLVQQEYPADHFEIIVTNDRSTDATASIVSSFQQKYPNIRLINIRENASDMPHKKNALSAAIALARNDILVCTDADCIAPTRWLQTVSEYFTDDVGIVAGYSPYHNGQAGSFLRYEELKNSVIAAAAVGAGVPFMCTGRNFAYRMQVFHEVGGFEKIKHSISGDDDLFLQLVSKETKWNIRYITSSDCAVRTSPPETLSQFIRQRTRHVSASAHYPFLVQTGYAFVHLFHLSIFIGYFFSPITALIALMIKFMTDGAMIAAGIKLFREEVSVAEFFFDEV